MGPLHADAGCCSNWQKRCDGLGCKFTFGSLQLVSWTGATTQDAAAGELGVHVLKEGPLVCSYRLTSCSSLQLVVLPS